VTQDKQNFEQFMKQREAAAQAYVSGDYAPLSRNLSQALPATFFGPGGGDVQGADVAKRYERDAASFSKGSESHFEILQMGASDGIGYWVGYQDARVRMPGKPDPVPMKLRVTELFRREGERWVMVHRHADMLSSEKK
jgi:hypothetical protein